MKLLGKWILDESDEHGLVELGDVALEFDSNGGLTYTIRGAKSDERILMNYKIDGCVLTTNQLSAPRQECTNFSFTEDGLLLLEIGGQEFVFRRELVSQ